MEYFEIAWDGFRILLVLFFFLMIVQPLVPERLGDAIEALTGWIFNTANASPELIGAAWKLASAISYFLGMLFVVGLLSFGLILFGYTVTTELGYTVQWVEAVYPTMARIASNPTAWAGATMVIGCTVAIGHSQNLSMARRKLDLDLNKHHREEREAREKRSAKEGM